MGFEKKMHWMIISRFLPSQTFQTLLVLSWWPYLFHWETRMNLKNSISPSLKLPPDLHLCPHMLSHLCHKALNIGALLGVHPSAAMANSDFSRILKDITPAFVPCLSWIIKSSPHPLGSFASRHNHPAILPIFREPTLTPHLLPAPASSTWPYNRAFHSFLHPIP